MTAVRVRGFSDEAFRRAVAESAPAALDEPATEAEGAAESTSPVMPEVDAPPAAEPDSVGDADDDEEPVTEADTIAARGLRYWTTGQGGTVKIRWNTPGDHGRCVRALTGKVRDPAAYCAKLHKIATGVWPGDKRNVGAGETDAGQPAQTSVQEATVGGATVTSTGRMLVRLIRAGVSLNGNAYPAHVLRAAAENRAWARGCLTFVDHATDEEDAARPSGSIKNLAGALTEDARWDEETQSLVAEVQLFHPWRETLTSMAEHIGMSIRAWVVGDRGEYEGRECFVVERIESGRSVDFVTKPAAGGGIISVLESVGNQVPTEEAENVGAWLESRLHLALTELADNMYGNGRLTREERIALSAAVGDALQAWVARVEQDAPQLFQRTRWDDPPEPSTAQAQETAPDTGPADSPPPSTAPEAETPPDGNTTTDDVSDGTPPTAPNPPDEGGPDMSGTTTGSAPVEAGTAPVADTATTPPAPAAESAQPRVDVQALVSAALTEALAPVTQQLATVQQALTAQQAENAALRNRSAASEAVAAALRAPEYADVAAQIGPRVQSRILDSIPTTAEGAVDTTVLGERIGQVAADEAAYVRQARAEALEAAGVGQPYGLGQRADEATQQDEGFSAELDDFFTNTLGLTSEAAKIAAKGRA
ncbi:hypothetical protein GCM10011608_09830 [Micromonospora sonchi]|uniref:Uncharacterized protein n=1 Tax=Micromonospora sonchi TaxID=1763543 RepID=A0A917TL17_9ACTN|nr:hypothetical protein [Micromonospora sonchi]GGM27088.1 hypothetical protein GCM10011608_09830 [Micromonospora sonchi]